MAVRDLRPDMPESASIQTVEVGDDYYHVRYRDPDEFDEIRTPDWADEASDSVVEGSEVRTGREDSTGDWEIQSVLVPVDAVSGEDEARSMADGVVETIES